MLIIMQISKVQRKCKGPFILWIITNIGHMRDLNLTFKKMLMNTVFTFVKT